MDEASDDQTSGSPVREPRPLMERLLTFQLPREVEGLRGEPAWLEGDRNARTLAKQDDLRVLLSALRPGSRLHEDNGEGRTTVQILEGAVSLTLRGESAELSAGQLAVLDAGEPWSLDASRESVVLLTIAGIERSEGV